MRIVNNDKVTSLELKRSNKTLKAMTKCVAEIIKENGLDIWTDCVDIEWLVNDIKRKVEHWKETRQIEYQTFGIEGQYYRYEYKAQNGSYEEYIQDDYYNYICNNADGSRETFYLDFRLRENGKYDFYLWIEQVAGEIA
jgi:hypothetical protein